jgi:hypothetical protein
VNRNYILRPNLGRVENIELKVILLGFRDTLDTKLPFWKGLVVNGLVKILSMEVRILTGELEGFIPHERVHAELRREVKFDESPFAAAVDKTEGVHSKTLHHTV